MRYSMEAEDKGSQVRELFKKHKSVSYTAHYEKTNEAGNTSKTSGLVHLLREKADTVFGGMVWVSEGEKYDTYSFYDLNKRYVVTKVIHKAWNEKMRGTDMGLSSIQNDIIYRPFFTTDDLTDIDYQTAKVNTLSDTTIKGVSCYVLEIDVLYLDKAKNAVDPEHTGKERLYVNRADDFPIMRRRWENDHGKTSSSKLEISNYQFDKIGKEQFSPSQIPSDYKMESRDREVPTNVQPRVRPREDWPIR